MSDSTSEPLLSYLEQQLFFDILDGHTIVRNGMNEPDSEPRLSADEIRQIAHMGPYPMQHRLNLIWHVNCPADVLHAAADSATGAVDTDVAYTVMRVLVDHPNTTPEDVATAKSALIVLDAVR